MRFPLKKRLSGKKKQGGGNYKHNLGGSIAEEVLQIGEGGRRGREVSVTGGVMSRGDKGVMFVMKDPFGYEEEKKK